MWIPLSVNELAAGPLYRISPIADPGIVNGHVFVDHLRLSQSICHVR